MVISLNVVSSQNKHKNKLYIYIKSKGSLDIVMDLN